MNFWAYFIGIYNLILVYMLYKSNKKKKLYYNNYKQCLLALGEYDPKLKEYLKRREKTR